MKKRLERHIPWNIAVCSHQRLLDLHSKLHIFRDRSLLSPQPGFIDPSRTGALRSVGHTPLSKNCTIQPSLTAPPMTPKNPNRRTTPDCGIYHCHFLKSTLNPHLVVCSRIGKPNMPANAPHLWFA
jgi:hypothetical protein